MSTALLLLCVVLLFALLLVSVRPTSARTGALDRVAASYADACGDCGNAVARVACARCWSHCALRRAPVAAMERALQLDLFGQPHALRLLGDALRRHESGALRGPLALHFAGDNGTGKSLTARLLAESRFALRDAQGAIDGLLYLRGEDYRG